MSQKLTFQNVKNRLFDNETWSSLKREHFQHIYDPETYSFRSINKIFSQAQLTDIKIAFEQKIDGFFCYMYGPKRDYSVHTKLTDFGEFCAWFSSEYSGTGNGDYYLLLNPTTAVFVESD